MPWHTIRIDDAWKQVPVAHFEGLGQRLWVHCHCGRQRVVEPNAFAAEVGVPMGAVVHRHLAAVRGEKHAQVWPEPYAMGRG